MLNITSENTNDGKMMMKLHGSFDDSDAAAVFKSSIDEHIKNFEHDIVLDLSGVDNINSHGIGKILYYYKKLGDKAGELYYHGPLHGQVKDFFEELMLTDVLKEYKS